MLKLTNHLAVLGVAACMAAPAIGADPEQQREPQQQREVQINVNENGAQVEVQRDEQKVVQDVKQGKKFGAYRSDDILSLKVKNADGKDLGKINDIVIGSQDGKVRYAALSFGGFLGLGDKLFAIPWQSLRMTESDDELYFVLNVSEQKLENAPGFDADKWPDFANTDVTGQFDKHYQTNLPDATRTDRPLDRTQPAAAPREGTVANQSEGSLQSAAYRLSEVKGFNVENAQGDDIADIEDVVIDIDEGKVRYVAVSFSESWGYGEKLFAMPWNALRFMHEGEENKIVLNVTQAQMKSATGFDNDDWPNFADPKWREATDKFYLNAPGAEVKVE